MHALMVKRLRRSPLKAESGVRVSVGVPLVVFLVKGDQFYKSYRFVLFGYRRVLLPKQCYSPYGEFGFIKYHVKRSLTYHAKFILHITFESNDISSRGSVHFYLYYNTKY